MHSILTILYAVANQDGDSRATEWSKENNTSTRRWRLNVTQRLPGTWEVMGFSKKGMRILTIFST